VGLQAERGDEGGGAGGHVQDRRGVPVRETQLGCNRSAATKLVARTQRTIKQTGARRSGRPKAFEFSQLGSAALRVPTGMLRLSSNTPRVVWTATP
jgi:hypothetical protein